MDWNAEAERASSLLRNVLAIINERDVARRNGGAGDVSASLRSALIDAERAIARLDGLCRDAEMNGFANANRKEFTRMRNTIRKLNAERDRLRKLESSSSGVATDKDALLGSQPNARKYDSYNMQPEALMQATQTEIKNQDDILDTMSHGLEQLKNIGIGIGNEADLHVKLLGDLEDEVDRGQNNLDRETKRAEKVTADTKTCWLYILIMLLLATLLALVIIRWH